MTTDATPRRDLILRLAIALPILLAGWLGVLAFVLRVGAVAPSVFVPFPPDGLIAALPDASVTGTSPISVTLQSDAPGLVARAYAAGAWIVLPAGLEACIPAAWRTGGA